MLDIAVLILEKAALNMVETVTSKTSVVEARSTCQSMCLELNSVSVTVSSSAYGVFNVLTGISALLSGRWRDLILWRY